jgi:hypothetical protein
MAARCAIWRPPKWLEFQGLSRDWTCEWHSDRDAKAGSARNPLASDAEVHPSIHLSPVADVSSLMRGNPSPENRAKDGLPTVARSRVQASEGWCPDFPQMEPTDQLDAPHLGFPARRRNDLWVSLWGCNAFAVRQVEVEAHCVVSTTMSRGSWRSRSPANNAPRAFRRSGARTRVRLNVSGQPRRAASMLARSILSHFHGSNVGATSCRITTTASK